MIKMNRTFKKDTFCKNGFVKNIFIFVLICLFFSGCKSTPKFSGNANLCIFVIDENNNPVENFQLDLSGEFKNETGITNVNGLCMFNSINSGKYTVCGYKNGYEILSDNQIGFSDKGEVFCIQVQSADFVFESILDLYSRNDFQQGIDLLNTIYFDDFNELGAVISFYKAFGFYKLQNYEAAENELKRIIKKDKKLLLTKMEAENLYDFLERQINDIYED